MQIIADLCQATQCCLEVKDGCHRCQICQAVKPLVGRQPGAMGLWDFVVVPTDVFRSICMDFVDLPQVIGKVAYDYVLVIVCRVNGYIVAISYHKLCLTARHVPWLFLRHYVLFAGLPKTIMSDIYQHLHLHIPTSGQWTSRASRQSLIPILRLVTVEIPHTHRIAWCLGGSHLNPVNYHSVE
jgi:hypothetical protein